MSGGILSRLRAVTGARGATGLGLSGDFATWADALAASDGYNDVTILDRTRAAALAVKRGEAAFERDSVAFSQPEYAWPLLSALLWVAAQNGGRLNVLDFGGSLGSTYYQHRVFWDELPHVHWSIVEQPAQVQVGRSEFQDERLRFHLTIEEAVAEQVPDVIVLSSVLQYLDRPHETLASLLALESGHLVVDRTTEWDGSSDRLCVQHVPPDIYDASYPCWVFSRGGLSAQLGEAGFVEIAQLGVEELSDQGFRYRERGILLARRAG